MVFLDELRRARESPVAAYQEFLLHYQRVPKDAVHAFFEGHDDVSFYINFILGFVDDANNVYTYKCGNKEGVYQTYHQITKLQNLQNKVLFFVDKDYSDVLGEDYPKDKRIYVTNYYSIENYLVSEEILYRIWNEIFHFNGINPMSFDIIKNKFQEELNNFYDFIMPLTVWIIHQRRSGIQIDLKMLKLSQLFSFNQDLILEKREQINQGDEMTIFEQIYKKPTAFNWQAMSHLITEELKILPPKFYVRGKFELWFFVKFVSGLSDLIKNLLLNAGEGIKIRVPIGEENAIMVLGPRIQIPESLNKFLKENINIK